MTKRRLWIGGSLMIGYVALYHVAELVLAPESTAGSIVANVGYGAFEFYVLGLCILALRASRGRPDRWLWASMGLWMMLKILADFAWAYNWVVRPGEALNPGLGDIPYAASYLLALGVILFAAWKTFGGTGALETLLDAAIFTVGAAGLTWPFVLGPLLDASEPGLAFWVNLAYPVGGLLIILACAFFVFGCSSACRGWPGSYFLVVFLAFLSQIAGDFLYFVDIAQQNQFSPGGWLNVLWLLAFAFAGIAALMGSRASGAPIPVEGSELATPNSLMPRHHSSSTHWRIAVPYVSIPILIAMIIRALRENGWRWDGQAQVLLCLGFAMVVLLVWRQWVVQIHNRRLYASLERTSAQLEEKVEDLADLSRRLEILNRRAHHLNSLQALPEVAEAALALACSFERSPGGWIAVNNNDQESVAAVRGSVDQRLVDDPDFRAVNSKLGTIRAVSLEIRSENLGTIFLMTPDGTGDGPDLLPVIAAHVATAIDNSRRYEEAVHLAERDALTGLFNHRGIHKRLAGESLRAQQSGSELSLIEIDLDDFKLLNDTYGTPWAMLC